MARQADVVKTALKRFMLESIVAKSVETNQLVFGASVLMLVRLSKEEFRVRHWNLPSTIFARFYRICLN